MQTIEFASCSRRACAPRRITFVNDLNKVEVEEVESFDLFLTSNFHLVRPDPYTAEVIIHDDSESELALIPPGLYLFAHENCIYYACSKL